MTLDHIYSRFEKSLLWAWISNKRLIFDNSCVIIQSRKGNNMYTVEFYEDKNGVSEVRDYFMKLTKEAETDKNARINKNKIFSYVRALEEYGTRIGSPIVKHIDGNLWELRPLSNRIFFFYWKDNKFVLIHYYIKKSQKAPKKEIKKAMSNIKDWLERNG